MKFSKITTLLFALVLPAFFTACSSGNDDSGSSGSGDEKHQWKPNNLTVTFDSDKYIYNSVLLTGSYTSSNYKVYARDDYYINETFATYDGYGELYNKDYAAETEVTINGSKVTGGTFTIETGKDYSIVFSYGGLTQTLNYAGNSLGGIISSSDTIKAIEGTSYTTVDSDGKTYSFKQVALQTSYLTSDSLYSQTVYLKDVTGSAYSIFTGANENSLVKFTGTSFMNEYTFNQNDAIVKIFHEAGLESAASATTLPYTLNLTVKKVSDIVNASASFNSVTKNTETNLLSVLKSNAVVTVYDSSCQSADGSRTNSKIGVIKLTSTTDSVTTLCPNFTLEIYDNKDFTGTPAASITSSTASDTKWTPGEGADFTTYSASSLNGTTTYTPSVSKVYYVKIIYNDGSNSFESKYLERTYTGTTYNYPFIYSIIYVK